MTDTGSSSLIIHVGLPKTATTSLQNHIFESRLPKDWLYIGVKQPRGTRTQTSIYKEIYSILQDNEEITADTTSVNQRLKTLLQKHQTLVLSEEMITVDSGQVSWQVKLGRLHDICEGINTKIILTVREPAAATFSLYVQQFHRNRGFENFEDYCSNSNQAKIFDYQEIVGILLRLFGNSVALIKFEDLFEGRKFLNSIELNLGFQTGLDSLPYENRRDKSSDGVFTDELSLAKYIRGSEWLKRVSQSPVLKPLKSLFKPVRDISIPGSRRIVEKPDLEALRERWLRSNRWLLQEFGIDYTS